MKTKPITRSSDPELTGLEIFLLCCLLASFTVAYLNWQQSYTDEVYAAYEASEAEYHIQSSRGNHDY